MLEISQKHIEKVIFNNPDLLDIIGTDMTVLGQYLAGFQPDLYWSKSDEIYTTLHHQVTLGTIYDLYTYYQFMTRNYPEEVISSGW